jgi:putative acetyltransferase
MDFKIRKATLDDVHQIAEAHLDSIRSIGPQYYPEEVVNEWAALVCPEMYIHAIKDGEVFFIAESANDVLGFSSHRVDDGVHGVSVYVRGGAARQGIGSALLRSAERSAIQAGAQSILIDASLAAVDFYKLQGFKEILRGEHLLSSGNSMPCVFMRKELKDDSRGPI